MPITRLISRHATPLRLPSRLLAAWRGGASSAPPIPGPGIGGLRQLLQPVAQFANSKQKLGVYTDETSADTDSQRRKESRNPANPRQILEEEEGRHRRGGEGRFYKVK